MAEDCRRELTEEEAWYFAAGGAVEGPVSRDALRALRAAGYVAGETMVWSAELTDWRRFDAVLGQPARRVPPPLPTQQACAGEEGSGVGSRNGAASPCEDGQEHGSVTDESESPSEGWRSWHAKQRAAEKEREAASLYRGIRRLLVAVVGLVGGLILLDQLAILLSPSYHDKRARAQVQWGLRDAEPYMAAVADAIGRGGTPRGLSNESLAIERAPLSPFVASIDVAGGVIVVTFGRHALWRIKGKRIAMQAYADADGSVQWACGYDRSAPRLALFESTAYRSVEDVGMDGELVEEEYLPTRCKRRSGT